MNPDHWLRADEVFAQALERAPEDREAFLDRACAGEPELRRKVERLLAADERDGSFLERPAGELLGILFDADEGGRIGPYRLLSRIGGGGMGTVYRARREDEHYQQDVAVKILRSGLQSTEALHRFLSERQILARLEHPNIARLYDGGSTEDGRPYLVMELVEGLPLDEYCDSHRLTVDQRLGLFRRICAAVQYAHQNLLVHRDLKPANILVTSAGEPKLLDFGIAKRLEPDPASDPRRTRTGLRIMTPSYASPEQIKGEPITTASDVYSLGVVLYELLVGRSPYPASAGLPHEIERAICEAEPERPSAALFRGEHPSASAVAEARCARPQALQRRLLGDLDNIVLMALRKDPGRRYGSVAQLSRDLESHLHSLPVRARPETFPYVAGKFLRRHRAGAFTSAVVLLLIAGFVTSLIAQGRRVARERDKARYALSFLVNTFKDADPYQTRGERLTAQEILARGEERVARDLSGQPDVQGDLMDAIGQVELGLGRLDRAGRLLERGYELRRKAHGRESVEAAESLEHLGLLEGQRSNPAGAEARLRQALALQRRRLGDRDLRVAGTLNELGEVLVIRAAYGEAERFHREALEIAREVQGPSGPKVAEGILLLADARRGAGDYAEAEKLFRQGLALQRRALGERDPRFQRQQTRFGNTLLDAGKFQEAEALLRRILEEQRRVLGPNHPDVVLTMNSLGDAVHRQGRDQETEAIDREALAIARAHFGPSHTILADLLSNLAGAIDAQDRIPEAIPYYQEAMEVRRRQFGEESWQVAQSMLLLAGAHRMVEDYPEGLRLAERALAILEKVEGPAHPHVAFAEREIAKSYLAQQRFAEAEPHARRSMEIWRRELRPGHPDLARSKTTLARVLIPLGRLDEAEALLRESNAALSAQFGADPKMAKPSRDLLDEIARIRKQQAPGDRIAAVH
ncbi:MAG: tetratricopeptide repeat protein [Thermoanaerobaculia bacterium]